MFSDILSLGVFCNRRSWCLAGRCSHAQVTILENFKEIHVSLASRPGSNRWSQQITRQPYATHEFVKSEKLVC